jgi:hypothetical protein
MNKKRFAIIVYLATIFLVACAPSLQTVQSAIAETQAALPTLIPIATTTPTTTTTATINPCTDRGWADIVNYLTQFNLQGKNIIVGTSISVFLQGLENYKEKIYDVVVDSCSEHARQLVVTSLGNQIYFYQSILTGSFQSDTTTATAMVESMKMILDAETELAGLGLNVKFP